MWTMTAEEEITYMDQELQWNADLSDINNVIICNFTMAVILKRKLLAISFLPFSHPTLICFAL